MAVVRLGGQNSQIRYLGTYLSPKVLFECVTQLIPSGRWCEDKAAAAIMCRLWCLEILTMATYSFNCEKRIYRQRPISPALKLLEQIVHTLYPECDAAELRNIGVLGRTALPRLMTFTSFLASIEAHVYLNGVIWIQRPQSGDFQR